MTMKLNTSYTAKNKKLSMSTLLLVWLSKTPFKDFHKNIFVAEMLEILLKWFENTNYARKIFAAVTSLFSYPHIIAYVHGYFCFMTGTRFLSKIKISKFPPHCRLLISPFYIHLKYHVWSVNPNGIFFTL
jgi:hypothetical protein